MPRWPNGRGVRFKVGKLGVRIPRAVRMPPKLTRWSACMVSRRLRVRIPLGARSLATGQRVLGRGVAVAGNLPLRS